MSIEPRRTFADAARCFADLVDRIPETAWDGPGLGEWDLRALVGHTSRSLTTLITYLQRPAPSEVVLSAVAYYEWVTVQVGADPAAVAERGRQAGVALGVHPADTVRQLLGDAARALDAVDADPLIETLAGGMLLTSYLPTRTFELTVHTLDIAAACGVRVTPPAEAVADALQLATAVATARGDGERVLLALTGRTPLPAGFSVV
ncbi:maleylpyruvate isomerase N-terminal domain-containing protein [Nakamurella sp. GG22]